MIHVIDHVLGVPSQTIAEKMREDSTMRYTLFSIANLLKTARIFRKLAILILQH